jgi:hypothetical protein
MSDITLIMARPSISYAYIVFEITEVVNKVLDDDSAKDMHSRKF